MINLFEYYDRASADFLRSQYIAKVAVPSVAIHDDGFLPKEVDSPIQYFCKFSNNHPPLYFDKLPRPRFWRIMSKSMSGELFDLAKKRADIIYSDGSNTRIIKEVRWLAEDGHISWVDHYNRHGERFAKTYYEGGQAALTKYFDNQGRQVITWNHHAGDVFLNTKTEQRHFPSLADFMAYYLQLRHYKLDQVFYNTLNQSLAVTMKLPKPGNDVLFWHERVGNEIPGNMKFLHDNATRTKHIVFQNYQDWLRHDQFLPAASDNVDFRYLGVIYPHPRSNNLHPNALILTNSDQIEQLEQLVKLLPNVHFSIAAVTEMSAKLMAYQDFKNVDLFPTVSNQRLKKLMADNDIYLDINYGDEILDAVRGAFEQNMLILGFKDTFHNPQFITPDNMFEKGNAQAMAQQILRALVQPATMKNLIDNQRQMAGDVQVAEFKKATGDLHE